MNRLVVSTIALVLIPMALLAQQTGAKKFMIFPIKVVSEGAAPAFSNEVAAVLGSELSKEGDLDIISGRRFHVCH